MLIGFTERVQRVSESEVKPGEFISITINISASRMPEINHALSVRYQMIDSVAIVEPLLNYTDTQYDALFGFRESSSIIQESIEVRAGQNSTSLNVMVMVYNDLIPEEDECFTIRIFSETPHRQFFVCLGDIADSFFCEYTICIEDDDSKCTHGYAQVKLYMPHLSVYRGGWGIGCVGRVGPIKDSLTYRRLGTQGQGPATFYVFCVVDCAFCMYLSGGSGGCFSSLSIMPSIARML